MPGYKIAFVLDDSLDSTDGVQQYMLTLGNYLSRQGHDVHYIVGETHRTDIPNVHSIGTNIKVRFNGNRMSIPLPVSKKVIAKLLADEAFDVIHVQMPYSPMLGARVVRAAAKTSAVVGTFHIAPQSTFVYVANSLLRFFLGRSLQRFDAIMSVSSVAQQFAKQTFGVDSVVVPNTFDMQAFRGAAPIAAYKNSFNIMFFGRLVERKGCGYFLQAIQRLHTAGSLPPNCKILVCGKGPLDAHLKAFVREHHMEDLVMFSGFVDEKDKAAYLATADVLVYPSTGGESFGIVLLEGMAASRGVVLAGNNPGYASVVEAHPEILFNPVYIPQFVDTISKYSMDATLRSEVHAWQSIFVESFDVPRVAKQVLDIYKQALRK